MLLTLPAPAASAAAVREQYRFAFLSCLGSTADGGTLGLTLGVARSDIAIDLYRWEAGTTPSEDPPAAGTGPDRPGTLTWEGESLTGAAPVPDTATGQELGTATFDVTATADGEPMEEFDGHTRDGNAVTAQADPDVEGPLLFGAVDGTTFTIRALSATVPMFTPSPGGGAEYAGDAQLSAVVEAGAATGSVLRFLRGHLRMKTTPLTLAGAVTMPDGRSYDVAGCTAYRQVIQVQAVQ